MSRDTLFNDANTEGKPFVFNAHVVEVFPDMIERSVPGYAQTLTAIGRLAERTVQSGTRVYDLGCSLGAALLAVRHAVAERAVHLVGIDNSAAMLNRCAEIVASDSATANVELLEGDICEADIANASMVILNFTLQFVAPEKRDALLVKIYNGLHPDGVLVLSEKIRFDEDRVSRAVINLHEDFKRDNGYSELEISRKRDAIENVLVPDSITLLQQRLTNAGFKDHGLWQQRYNFVSMLAIK